MAYREMGDLQSFRRLLQLTREEHDRQIGQGADWWFFWYVDALYWVLAGDFDRALELLEQAVDAGMTVTRSSKHFLGFEALFGDLRFLSLQEQMLTNLNRQRKLAGLDQLNTHR